MAEQSFTNLATAQPVTAQPYGQPYGQPAQPYGQPAQPYAQPTRQYAQPVAGQPYAQQPVAGQQFVAQPVVMQPAPVVINQQPRSSNMQWTLFGVGCLLYWCCGGIGFFLWWAGVCCWCCQSDKSNPSEKSGCVANLVSALVGTAAIAAAAVALYWWVTQVVAYVSTYCQQNPDMCTSNYCQRYPELCD